jgi:glyoxylase-like metal-dependent hydrolase (beta-lactamase superfamily II)
VRIYCDEEQAMEIKAFFDPATFTLTYVVHDPGTRDAIIIDPVLDYEPGPSQTATHSADEISAYVSRERLRVRLLLETHAHADHLSASQLLKRRHESEIAIGDGIREVQRTFKAFFSLHDDFRVDGSQFDRLLRDGETVEAGSLSVHAVATPGHTPACMSYVVGDAVFTGDALFMEDYGVGRCDFPGGSADDLYRSVHDRLYALPEETRVFVGHDYLPNGRELRYETTIGRSKRANVQLRGDTSKEAFVALREARDATLASPRLLFPSVQVNVDGGLLPAPRANGTRYLHVPINVFAPTDDTGAPRRG